MRPFFARPATLAALPLLLTALFAAGCARKGGEIVLGEYGSTTGTTASFGISTKNGVEMALDEANAEGGIGGEKLRVVAEDDQSKPEEAATVVQKLINQDRVVAVIGEVASSRSLAAAPICQAASVPMISPSSTNPEVTLKGDFIFRACFLDEFQGRVMARFTFQNLGLKKVAILKDVKNDYSVGLAQYYGDEFTKLGGQIVATQAYNEGDSDFRSQLTSLKAQKPDAIFLPGYYTEVGSIARQARKLGITQPILGGDGWVSDQLLKIGGPALNGCYYSNHYASDSPDTALQSFFRKYRERHGGSNPDAIAGLAYDASRLLFDAMRRLAAEDPKAFGALDAARANDTVARKAAQTKLRDLIWHVKDFPGITGMINFDANRNPVKPAVVIKIEDGVEKFAASMSP